MTGAWGAVSHTQNAWIESAIRSGYGSGAEAPALPGRDRRLRNLHRRRDRTRHLAGGGVTQPDGARAGSRRPAAAPHEQDDHPDHGRSARAGAGPAGPGGGRQPRRRGDHRAYAAPHRSRLVGHGPSHPRVPAPLGGRAPGGRAAPDSHQLGDRRPGRGPVRPGRAAHRGRRQAVRQRHRGSRAALLRTRGRRSVGQAALDPSR